MKLYKIHKWNERYENNRTRDLKNLNWVPIPNKQDGDGYTLIMDRPNGAAIYGSWIAIIQIASRCDNPALSCGRDGTLLRDGGKPHDSDSLSRMSRIPSKIITEALDLLSSPDVGWLEVSEFQFNTANPAGGCGNPAGSCDNPAGGCLEQNRTEGNRTEQNGSTPLIPLTGESSRESKTDSLFENLEASEKKERPHPYFDDFGNEIPEGFRTDDFMTALKDWHTYKREKRQHYKPTGAKNLIGHLVKMGSPEVAIQGILHSMASNYAGVFESKSGTNGNGRAEPAWQTIQRLEAAIAQHPANTGYAGHDDQCTLAQRQELARMRDKVTELRKAGV
jgi:hypothetical protein